MEGYNNSSERANFPAYINSAMVAPNPNIPHHHHHMDMNTLVHLQSAHPDYFQSAADYPRQAAAVKSEVVGSSHLHAYLGMGGLESNKETTTSVNDKNNSELMEAMKAKIIAHPQYSVLLEAYMDCQKVGAPPEVAARLSAVRQEYETRQAPSVASSRDASKDPELDQFMEAYYDMLVKYKEELTRPVQDAMDFMRKIESQLNLLSNGRARIITSDERSEGIGSSDEEQENSGGEMELAEIDPRAEDRELKNHLLKKYSGYLGSLKQELSKKKKKGKLPKEARQKLLSWWELHYKWPYPSESEKVALAEATGLDQKQINNWFINQRKRHWKPSEDMQLMVMDGLHHPHNAASYYMEGYYSMGDGPYRYGT